MYLPSGDAARWCGPSSSTGTSPTGTLPSSDRLHRVDVRQLVRQVVGDGEARLVHERWHRRRRPVAARRREAHRLVQRSRTERERAQEQATHGMKSNTMTSDRFPKRRAPSPTATSSSCRRRSTTAAGAALVALLVERGDAARLQRLGDGADKALAKRARKALHLLRTRGVAAPAAAKREYPPAGAARAARGAVAGLDHRRPRRAHRVAGARRATTASTSSRRSSRTRAASSASPSPTRRARSGAQHAARVVGRRAAWRWRASPSATRAQLIEDGYQRTLARRARAARGVRARAARAWATTSPRSATRRSTWRRRCRPAEVRGRLGGAARAARAAHVDSARGCAAGARSRDRQHRHLQAGRRSDAAAGSSSSTRSRAWPTSALTPE